MIEHEWNDTALFFQQVTDEELRATSAASCRCAMDQQNAATSSVGQLVITAMEEFLGRHSWRSIYNWIDGILCRVARNHYACLRVEIAVTSVSMASKVAQVCLIPQICGDAVCCILALEHFWFRQTHGESEAKGFATDIQFIQKQIYKVTLETEAAFLQLAKEGNTGRLKIDKSELGGPNWTKLILLLVADTSLSSPTIARTMVIEFVDSVRPFSSEADNWIKHLPLPLRKISVGTEICHTTGMHKLTA